MKRKLALMLLAIITVVACVFGAAGCAGKSNTEHVHSYASTWSYDETYHWHAATCEHKNLVSDKEEHTFSGNRCTVCGYERENLDVPQEYSVIFDANNGSFEDGNMIEITVEGGSEITEPEEEPYRKGYTFTGWSLSDEGTVLWDFETDKVSENITLYAVWVQNVSVVFDANGGKFKDGESKYTVELTVGDVVTAPESPENFGYTFNGWYKDSELTEAWDFENDTVTEDTTIYAGWLADIKEHDVTFVLNYDGAENVVQSTQNGLVTFVPQREGYVFNGWWYSDGRTDEGYILSQKFDTAEIVTEDNLVLYAEWVEEATASIQLSAPSVSIDRDQFSWSEIEGATGYRIIVTRSGSSEEVLNTTITKTYWTFPSNYEAGYYTIRIRANGDGTNAVNSSYVSKSYAHKTLGTVSEINFDLSSSVLTWTSVKNAASYEVYINNKLADTLTYTSYDMSGYDAGTYQITIVAQRNGYVSSSTRSTIQKLRLRTPESVICYLDSETRAYVIVWDSVLYADTYILTIGEREVRIEDTTYTISATADMWNENQKLILTVKAFDSNADYLVSASTEEIELTKVYSVTVENENTVAAGTSMEGSLFALPQFTVSFDLNGADGSVAAQIVTSENGLVYPEVPKRSGYVFIGWFKDSACTERYDFTADVNSDLKLYAGWYEITTTGYGNYVTTNPYSTYTVSTNGTSSSSQKYIYFSVLSDGEYKFNYSNSSSNSSYGTRVTVYNVTQGSSILANKNCYSTSTSSVTFNAKAGDVIRVSIYRSNTYYYATFYFRTNKSGLPTAGGLATSYYIETQTTNELFAFAEYGSTVTLTAADKDENYFFIGWYNGEELVSEEKTITFKVEKDVVYTLKYGCYTLTADKGVNGGTVSDYNQTPVKAGKEITITAQTAAGYTFIGWYNGDTLLTSELSYTFTMPEENITYTAEWIKVTAESNNTSAGTVTSLNGSYEVGDEVTITATTKTGYTFVGWFKGEELISSDLSYTFAMPAVDTTFTAKWIKVTLSRNDTSAGTISSLSGRYVVGQEVTITASTRNGYTFIGWYEGDKLLTNELSYTFKMPSTETTFTAQWIDCPVTLEQSIEYAGYVYGLEGPTRVGEEVTVTAETYSGYTWIGWYDGETELTKELSYTFVMSADEKILTAKWECYTITTAVGEVRGGSISTMSNVRKTAGEIVTIEATTYNGYMWMGWYNGETLVSLQQEYTFAMPSESIVYTATWMKCPVTLAKNIEEAGNVSGMGNTTTVGEEITITSATNEGYTWLGWYNGEILLTQDVSYTFTMPAESITYTACWAAYTLTTAVNNVVAGTVTEYENYKITAGEEITVEANTNDGYTFIGWYDGDALLSENEVFEFTMPAESVTYTAKWNAYTLTVNGTSGGNVATNEQKYIVSFDLNGVAGNAPQPQLVTSSGGIVYPEVPISQGYVFVGWYKDKEGAEKYDFTSDISCDLVLYAKWYKITITGNSNSSIDIISKYNSSSSYYYSSNTNTSSSNPNYVYFSTLTSGDYSFYYRTQGSTLTYATYFYVYNVTQNKVILANAMKYSTSYSTVSFTAKEGDVIYVRAYKYSSSASTVAPYMFYIEGAEYPVAGGKAVYSPVSYNVTKGKDVSLSATTLPGYTFVGWFNGETRVSTELTYNFAMPSENVEYTAKWIACPVTLEKNIVEAGSVSGLEGPTRVGEEVTISATSNPGYTWLGWYNGDDLVTDERNYSFIMSEEGDVYTATWARYTLTTEINNENAGVINSEYNDVAIVAGQTITLSAASNKGYTFLGWYNEEQLLSADLEFTFEMPYSSVVYTAKWAYYTFGVEAGVGGSVNDFKTFATVTFDYNDGSGTVKTQRVTATQGLTYPGVIYRTGYVFRGWFSDSGCTRLFDFTADITNDVVAYAGWHEITTNGYSTSVIDISSSYKTSSSPYTTSNGSTSDTSAKYVYFTALNGGTYTFYYKTSSSSSSYATYFYVYNVTKNQVILSNTRRYSTSYASSTFTANAGDVIYIRTYRSNTNYSSNYSFYITGGIVPSSGGTFEGINKNVNTDGIGVVAGEQITISAASNYGYIWLGWYDGDELVSTDMTYTFGMPAKSIVYTAKWTYYSVTTEQNISEAGSITYKNDEPVAVGDKVTISASSNYGYIWLGWYDGDELVSTDMTYTFDMPSKSVVYTAKWTYYSVTTEQNNDSAGSITHMEDEPIKVGDSVTITANTNDGYTWLGWYDGETLLTSELSYNFVMPENNVVYTAKWVECPITLEKNIESAGEVTGNEKTVLGQETTITAITNDGYTFIGWYSESGDIISDGLNYTFTVSEQPVVYFAKWIESPISINVNMDEAGTVTGHEKTILDADTTIKAISNEGYEWLGWYIGDELITTQETYTFKLTEEPVTFTAKWGYAEITLHYIVNGEEVNSQKYQLNAQLENLWNYSGSNFSGWHSAKNFNSYDVTVTTTKGLALTDNNAYLYGGTYSGTSGLVFMYRDECYEVVGYSGTSPEVTIPSSFNGLPVSSIAQSAFMNHSELTQVVIPDSVDLIAKGAFSGCSNLQSITIPFVGGNRATEASAVTLFGYIFGENAYDGGVATRQDYSGQNAVTYYIPETLTKVTILGGDILRGAFQNCSFIKEVIIGDDVTAIGYEAFKNCTVLENITIGNKVETIDWYAFSGCSKLYFVTIPDSVTSIGAYAFRSCYGLVSVTIGAKVTSIGMYAFSSCYKLVEVVNKSSLNLERESTNYGYVAYYARWIASERSVYVTEEGLILATRAYNRRYVYGYVGSAENLVIPNVSSSISGGYSGIYQYAFYGNTVLKSIEIPSCIILIEAYAFAGCRNLETITGADEVARVGEHAFSNTAWEWDLPTGYAFINTVLYKYIGQGSSTVLSIPDGTTSIAAYAFQNCSWITQVAVPLSVTFIGEGAFSGCYSITSMTLPFVGESDYASNVNYSEGWRWQFGYIFGSSRYSNATMVTSININHDDFYVPNSLTNVKILSGGIITSAFYDCTMLKSIVLDADVTELGWELFAGCNNLTELTLPFVGVEKQGDTNKRLFGYFFDQGIKFKTGYTSVKVNNSTYYIPTSLTNVTILSGDIYQSTFENCTMLTSVTIGSGVTCIEANAFAGCSNLTNAKFQVTGGWKRYSSSTVTTGYSLTLTNSATAARYLTSTYVTYYWKKG